MFFNLLRLESDKLFRRWMLWISLALALLPGILFQLIAFNVGRDVIPVQTFVWPNGVVNLLAFANGYYAGAGYAVYALACVIGAVTAQEYAWRTMQLWLSRGVPRSLLLIVKFLVALLCVLLVGVVFLLAGCIISLILSYQLHGSVNIQPGDIGVVLLGTLRTTYSILPYVALAFLLVVSMRSLVAVGGVPLFMLAIEAPLSFLLPALGLKDAAHYLPAGLAQTLTMQNYNAVHIPTQGMMASPGDPVVSSLLVALYTLVLFALSLWIFQRQNLAN
ncbi:MAG: ABC transporter permease [Ktedonobacteraceae bacterium]|nr:ABC transporter permease [Ktedonobacteraceae bacterium]